MITPSHSRALLTDYGWSHATSMAQQTSAERSFALLTERKMPYKRLKVSFGLRFSGEERGGISFAFSYGRDVVAAAKSRSLN